MRRASCGFAQLLIGLTQRTDDVHTFLG
jgi:hypothetical protein